jgi:hypothetical protein
MTEWVIPVELETGVPLAIEPLRDGPSYVNLDEHKRQKMWDSGILRIAGESAVYEFMKE